MKSVPKPFNRWFVVVGAVTVDEVPVDARWTPTSRPLYATTGTSVAIEPGGFLVVFASGKNRRPAGGGELDRITANPAAQIHDARAATQLLDEAPRLPRRR